MHQLSPGATNGRQSSAGGRSAGVETSTRRSPAKGGAVRRTARVSGGESPDPSEPSSTLVSPLLLDTKRQGCTFEWSRQQKRCFGRAVSWLTVQEADRADVLWVTLTSSPASRKGLLWRHHRELLRRVDRKLGFKAVRTFVIETGEGYGVLHCLWAWVPPVGVAAGTFDIKGGAGSWLSGAWDEIHGAYIVDSTPYRYGTGDTLSRYAVSQYVGGQSAFVRYAWSWRSFGYSLPSAWACVRSWYPYPRVCQGCRDLLRLEGSAATGRVREHHPMPDKRAMLAYWRDVLLGYTPVPDRMPG